MHNAMNNAAHQAIISLLFSTENVVSVTQFLELNVSRANLVADSLRELSNVTSNDLKKPLKVGFVKFRS